MFSSLRIRSFRLYLVGMNIAFVGMWMLRVAQGWLALELTGSGTALGFVTACMYLPTLVVGTFAGVLADRYPKRRLIYLTTSGMGLTAMVLGVLEITGLLQIWHLYLLVLVFGVLSAIDTPTRLSFVVEMVGPESLANAVALNSASVNAARLVGPAVAGLLIAATGTGWVILLYTGAAATAVLLISRIRATDLYPPTLAGRTPGQFRAGLAYVRQHPDLRLVFVTMLAVGTFGMAQETLLPLAASHVFERDASVYGLFTAAMAVGTLGGALVAAVHGSASTRLLTGSCLAFGVTWVLVAAMPSVPSFATLLPLLGLCQISAITAANAIVQLSVDPAMRGRVMALYLTALLGGAPLGAPLLGWVAQTWGTRPACVLAGLLTVAGGLLGVRAGKVRRSPPGSPGRTSPTRTPLSHTDAPRGAES